VLERALEAGSEAVAQGPSQLAALREAGVVDAGAYGLTVIIAGVLAALRGQEAVALERQPAVSEGRPLHLPHHGSSQYRYCTNFAVTGKGLEGPSFVSALESLGDSVLVVGDQETIRVHVHTDDPDAAAKLFDSAGEVSRFDVADMREQVAERAARLAVGASEAGPAASGVVAVVSGEGIAGLYRDLGAEVVSGGATLNPSTYELLAAVHAVNAKEVVILPGSSNVVMAAERAVELSEKAGEVVAIHEQQVGLMALLAFDPSRPARDNAEAMAEAAAGVRSAGVARAARADAEGRFAEGDAVAYAGGHLLAYGEPEAALAAAGARVAEGSEVLTCLAGEGAPLDRRAVEAVLPDGLEVEYHEGGQAAWWWLLCAE